MISLNFRYRFSSGGESWFCGKYGGGLFSIKFLSSYRLKYQAANQKSIRDAAKDPRLRTIL